MSVLSARKRSYKPADERREQILDCALEVFSSKGYHGASIADVCARAGIGRATLYQYFDDKRDVLVALADRIARKVTDVCAAQKPVRLPPGIAISEEQAVRYVEARFGEVLAAVFEDRRTARLVLRAGRGADGIVDEMLDRIERDVIGIFESNLAEAQRAGVLRSFDVRFVARFILGGIEKVVLASVDEDRPIDLAHLAREVALIELTGILARSAVSEANGVARPKTERNT